MNRLTDPAIALAYMGQPGESTEDRLGDGHTRYGDPVGPPTRMPDGVIRQAFTAGVLEHAATSPMVRMTPIGKLTIDADLVTPGAAAVPVAPPPLPADPDLGPAQPTTVKPFVVSLLAGLALYIGLPTIAYELFGRPRRRGNGPGRSS
jgi:hypothetical protein